MKVVGIIAEYNPFHNGHKYHIEQAKKLTGADIAIVIMSGNFTQRGNPAFIDKYSRTKMALACGADMVIELPVFYACGSAEYFAMGAISLLNSLGVVDYLCFGSECGSIECLTQIAELLIEEPDELKENLQNYLKMGYSFPQARSMAIAAMGSKYSKCSEIISSPNNILGIEYIKALIRTNSSIIPYTNLRIGADYHDVRFHTLHSSAIAIRQSLETMDNLSLIVDQVPCEVYSILEEHFHRSFPLYADDTSLLLKYKLLLDESHGYTDYIDISDDLSARILNNLHSFTTFSSFCELLKTRELTYARISRCLIHILLNMKKTEFNRFCESGYVHYIRMLGFKKDSSGILTEIKKHATVPLISKLGDAKDLLSEIGLELLEYDMQASHIYDSIALSKYNTNPSNEFIKQIIIF